MTDPLTRMTAEAPPIIGSGCTQRYDPQALGSELGTEFPGAAALWAHLTQSGCAGVDALSSAEDSADRFPAALD